MAVHRQPRFPGSGLVYNDAGTAHLIADVAGWFGDGAQSTFTALAPARILDTRTAAKPGPASVLELQVTWRAGVPATGVTAVVLNLTVTEPSAGSFLTAWPAGVSRPLASNLNYVAGLTVPNLVIVKVGDAARSICTTSPAGRMSSPMWRAGTADDDRGRPLSDRQRRGDRDGPATG